MTRTKVRENAIIRALVLLFAVLLLSGLYSHSVRANYFSSIKIEGMEQVSLYKSKIKWSASENNYDGYFIKKVEPAKDREYTLLYTYDISQEKDEGYEWTILKTVSVKDTEAEIETVPDEKAFYCVQGYYLSDENINLTSRYSSNGSKWYSIYKKVKYDGKYYYADQNRASDSILYASAVPSTKITMLRTGKDSSAKLVWLGVDDAIRYDIYCSEGKGKYKKIASPEAGKTSFVHKDLKSGCKYSYYIKCVFPDKYVSQASNTRSVFISNNKGKKKIVTDKNIKMLYKYGKYTGNWADSDYTFYYEEDGFFYVAAVDGAEMNVYKLDGNLKQKSKKTVKLGKYDSFGAFYHGSDKNNYVVLGFNNFKESDSKVVITVTKFTDKWKKKKTAKIKGGASNSFKGIYAPFEAAGCDMTMQGKWLYIALGRKMYIHSDGLRHQSNIAFRVNTKNMKVTEHNISYCSHSFNQITQYSADTLYQLDHGDAYPRCVKLTISEGDAAKADMSEVVTKTYSMFDINGSTGDNFTGLKLGGLGVGDDYVLATGLAQPHRYKIKGVKGSGNGLSYNVFVSVLNKETGKAKVKWLTEYNPKSSKVNISEVRMVTLSDDRFAVLWSESKDDKTSLKYYVVNQKGKVVYKTSYADVPFDGTTQPVLTGGFIQWASRKGETKKYEYGNYVYYSTSEQDTRVVKIPAKF